MASVCLQRVIDGRHHEVGDSATRIAPTTNQCVGCTDDISVEETSGPHLTRYECTSKDTHKETDSIEASCVLRSTSQSGGNRTKEQAAHERIARPKSITKRSSNGTHDERSRERDDVGVGYFILGEVHVLLDGDAQLWSEC